MAFSMNITKSDVYPPLPVLQDKIDEYVAKVDFVTSANILNGFDYEYTAEDGTKTTYHFSYKSDDQQNFSTQNEMTLLVANNTIAQLQSALADAVAQLAAANGGAATISEPVTNPVSALSSDDIATTDTFKASWQGHAADGTVVTLEFDFNQFVRFTIVAGMHKQNTIGLGWIRKAKFRACTNEDQLEAYAKEIDLDKLVVDAREVYKDLGITPERVF